MLPFSSRLIKNRKGAFVIGAFVLTQIHVLLECLLELPDGGSVFSLAVFRTIGINFEHLNQTVRQSEGRADQVGRGFILKELNFVFTGSCSSLLVS